jgi:hypothetical protein
MRFLSPLDCLLHDYNYDYYYMRNYSYITIIAMTTWLHGCMITRLCDYVAIMTMTIWMYNNMIVMTICVHNYYNLLCTPMRCLGYPSWVFASTPIGLLGVSQWSVRMYMHQWGDWVANAQIYRFCGTFILSDNHVAYINDYLIISCINIQILWYCSSNTTVMTLKTCN